MSQPGFSLMLGVAVSFLGALALTPLVRFAARRWGMVARPKADRWHRQPTALMGGVAIFVSVMTAELLVAPMDRQVVALLGASSFLFLVGLLDDLVTLKPYQKLAAQVLAALALIGGGLTLSWIGHPAPNAATTLLWLVGITNAVNLLDNMDGLAAGTTVIVRIDRNGRPRAGARSRRAGPDPGLKTPVGKPWDDHRGVVIEVGGRAGRTRRRERASREGALGLVVALLPSWLKVLVYRHVLGYRIGRGVRIGLSPSLPHRGVPPVGARLPSCTWSDLRGALQRAP